MSKPLVVKDQPLEEVLEALGLRTEESLVPNHRRLYDSQGLINVCDDETIWDVLERYGLIVRAKKEANS